MVLSTPADDKDAKNTETESETTTTRKDRETSEQDFKIKIQKQSSTDDAIDSIGEKRFFIDQ